MSFNALFNQFKADTASSQITVKERELERLSKEDRARTEALEKERERDRQRALQKEKDRKAREEREKKEQALRLARKRAKEQERIAAEREKSAKEAADREAKAAARAGSSSKRTSNGAGGSNARRSSPPAAAGPVLSFEERRRQALRKEMAAEEAAERKANGGSRASSSLGRIDGPSSSRASPSLSSGTRSPIASSSDRTVQLTGRRAKGVGPSSLSKMSSSRAELAKKFNPSTLTKLDRGKQDRRTIEEIERDLRAKKGHAPPTTTVGLSGAFAKRAPPTASAAASTSAATSSSLSKRARADDDTAGGEAKRAKLPATSASKVSGQTANISTAAKASARSSNGIKVSGVGRPVMRRRDSDDDDDDSDADEYDTDDFDEDDSDAYSDGNTGRGDRIGESVRDEIWRIMGRDRRQYQARQDSDSDDDMEAGADEVLREDARATKFARMEDAQEEAKLAAHAEAKKKTKEKLGAVGKAAKR